MVRAMEKYIRPGVKSTPFCPGCGHGILMGLILRAIDELKMDMNKMVFVSGIGCAAWIPSPHFDGDTLHTLHGRALAFATGVKLFNPELCVMVVSGDGDLSSIGGNHLIHAARRNIDLKVICANNMIYGMTGGQVASTTPAGARTATTGEGNPYQPFNLSRLVEAAGATYVAKYSVTQPVTLDPFHQEGDSACGLLLHRSPLSLSDPIREEESHRPAGGYDSGSHREVYSGGRSEGTDRRGIGREDRDRRILTMSEITQMQIEWLRRTGSRSGRSPAG